MTTTPTKLIVDCSTGVTTEVEFTAEEIAQAKIDAIKVAEIEAERVAQVEVLAALKDSARAKLVAGEPLTEEEAATIVL
jgi:hypothetical protein